MDVDLLRPGTVPISPETVLWFEFLLDKDLLLKHLQKTIPDPAPTELINKFTIAIFECSKNEPKRELENGDFIYNIEFPQEQSYNSTKAKALKILVLKVAAFIKWNLNTIRSLPIKIQISLLQDVLYFTNNNTWTEIPNVADYASIQAPSDSFLFALIIYHRWLIVSSVHGIHNNLPRMMMNNEMSLIDESQIFTQENIKKSLDFLNLVLTWKTLPNMLTFDCFLVLTENNSNIEFDWSKAIPVSKDEYFSQIHYELAMYYFFKEDYEQATAHFVNSMECYKNNKGITGFMTFSLPTLESYLVACNTQTNNTKNTLLHQLRISVAFQFTGLLNILIQDNIHKEIPIVHRINIELDIVAALSSGKFTVARDLLPKVQALNTLRCILEKKAVQFSEYDFNTDAFVWALSSLWQNCSLYEKDAIILYMLELITNYNDKAKDFLCKISSHNTLSDITNHPDIKCLLSTVDEEVGIPPLLENLQWALYDSTKKRNPYLEVKTLEQQIVSSYDSKELRELLVKLASKDTGRAVWKINSHWTLPIPLQSVIMSSARGFLQDFGYILLAKSRELMLRRDWSSAIDLLQVLEAEIQMNANNTMNKLSKLITWEKLLIQINQLIEEWPAPYLDKQALIVACEQCLKTNDVVLPRTEVMEQSMVCLLNLNYWDIANCIEKRWSNFEISIAITLACQDIVKLKGNKKYAKDLWDMVLPIFSSNINKRSGMGNPNSMHHDSPLNNDKIVVLSHFMRLRDSIALSVVISMLTKLYNILKDEANFELNIDNLMLWPSVVSNANSYNVSSVFEVLSQIVTQGLQHYPTNCSWLRLMGDINFVSSNYEKSLSFYLKCLLISTDYFNNLSLKHDDTLFRRMIKCCLVLGCHTQVAVLTQFFEEPDYLLAFRSLSEQKCNDAIDAYYHCFWDSNILEYLVHIHHKKTEFQRRKRAIQSMGLLELNANNNEEIQRESSILRKKAFLRALCKQYIPL